MSAGVQTFLPYPDFAASAHVLDARRLGKQRVEALQVLRALTVPGYGWRHHPAVKMWRGYEEALTRYGLQMCEVWTSAGRPDTCAAKLAQDLEESTGLALVRTEASLLEAGEMPKWYGDQDFHRSHQSALLRKDRAHYEKWFPGVPDDLPYVWPASDRESRSA